MQSFGSDKPDKNIYCIICKQPITAKDNVNDDLQHVSTINPGGKEFYGWIHRRCIPPRHTEPETY